MRELLRSNPGLKAIMAVTGLIWVGYLITHVAANLLVLTGPTLINRYSALIHGQPAILYGARAVLFVAIVLHVWAALTLTRRARAARPIGYGRQDPQVSTIASRTMRIGGIVVLVFVVYHILHFTLGTVHPSFAHGNPYLNVVTAFRNPVVVLIYEIAMVAVGLHLFHGTWSSFRSLGLVKPSLHPLRHRASLVVAGAIWLGFAVIPILVFAGVGR